MQHGFSRTELDSLLQGSSLRNILNNPINAPYKLFGRAVIALHSPNSLVYLRRVSAALGLLTLTLFCLLLTIWHNYRTAIFGSIIFGTSSWFLHISRLATPEVLMFGLFALFVLGSLLFKTANSVLLIFTVLFAIALIYIPGMIWFIGLLAVINAKEIDEVFKKRLGAVSVAAVLSLLLLAPLGYGIFKRPDILKSILNLPIQGWPSVIAIFHSIADVPLRIFLYGHPDSVTWLDHLPLLNVFCSAMFVFGVYYYLTKHKERLMEVGAVIVFGAVFISLGGNATFTTLVPFIFLLVAAGIEFVIDQWMLVFPRNPIAQYVGILSISLVVLLSILYQTREYFIAWPLDPATHSSFTISETDVKPVISGTIKG